VIPLAIPSPSSPFIFRVGALQPRWYGLLLACGVLLAGAMARRQFREIARVAGLTFTGYPGQNKSVRQIQASSGLLFDVFMRYDRDNLLLDQAHREVLERQLERSRLGHTLERLSRSRILLRDLRRPSPLSFPLLVDRTRNRVSSEKLADRVRRMRVAR
jgi:ATP-dependent Lhr-like helicase